MKKLGPWLKLAASASVISVGLAGCALGPTSAPSAATQQRIEAAQTRVDHEALAAYYDGEASGARAKSAEHRKMGAKYLRYQPGRGGGNMTAHCNALVGRYDSVATEYEALAAGHRQMAAQARS